MAEPCNLPAQSPVDVIRQLHSQCSDAITESLGAGNSMLLGEAYLFAADLALWRESISKNLESSLLDTATSEYILSILSAYQGQYRSSFKSLRLTLELCMQCSLLSADLVARSEWLSGKRDTYWSLITCEDNGPVSLRFCRAFFPELAEHAPHYRGIIQLLYRELSECIHGNVPSHIPLPSSIKYCEETLRLWHRKAAAVRLVINFALSLRFMKEIEPRMRAALYPVILDQLGHIAAIREASGSDA